MPTKLAIYHDPVVCRRFHVGASLHSHTLHSQDCLFFLDCAARKSGAARWLLNQVKASYRRRTGAALDLNSVYWTPPLAPHDAYTVEANQLASLGLAPIVSITDHDDIDAGLTLSPLDECRFIPISFEWTVPFRETFFHIGLHNLPRRGLHETFRILQAWRKQPTLSSLPELLFEVASVPDTLVIFNHPFWNESSAGRDLHVERAKEFVRRFGPFLHAIEINGMRPHQENQEVIGFAEQFQKPVIAGSDRHATEPNVLINLTNARTFAELAAEVRAGYSSILEMPAYREPLGRRVRRETREVLADHPHHGRGWVKWDQRVFYTNQDGDTKSLAECWQTRPAVVDVIIGALRMARRPQVQWRFRSTATPSRQPLWSRTSQ